MCTPGDWSRGRQTHGKNILEQIQHEQPRYPHILQKLLSEHTTDIKTRSRRPRSTGPAEIDRTETKIETTEIDRPRDRDESTAQTARTTNTEHPSQPQSTRAKHMRTHIHANTARARKPGRPAVPSYCSVQRPRHPTPHRLGRLPALI